MTEIVLDVPEEVIGYLDQVRRLADANRDALGFLSVTAYEEAAMKGCLWVAVTGTAKKLRGYLFFGVRFPRLRVYQVYVCPECDRNGFDSYTGNRKCITALVLRSVERLGDLVTLDRIRLSVQAFQPPQFYARLPPGSRLRGTLDSIRGRQAKSSDGAAT